MQLFKEGGILLLKDTSSLWTQRNLATVVKSSQTLALASPGCMSGGSQVICVMISTTMTEDHYDDRRPGHTHACVRACVRTCVRWVDQHRSPN